jgi:hypothetical protein
MDGQRKLTVQNLPVKVKDSEKFTRSLLFFNKNQKAKAMVINLFQIKNSSL